MSLTRRNALGGGLGIAAASLVRPARAEVTSVKIGLQFGLVYLPVVVAHAEGFFTKRAEEAGVKGLAVDLIRFSGSTAMNEAMLSNSIQVGTIGTVGGLIIWEKTRGRQHIKSIANLSNTSYGLFTNRPGVKTLADFKPGDKIALPALNSPQAIMLRLVAEKQLGDRTKADPMIVNLPHPDATAALLAGQAIAGYFATPPFFQVVSKDPKITRLFTAQEMFGVTPSGATLATSQGFVEDNPKVAKAMFTAMDDAMKLITSDPKRAARIYLDSEKVQLAQGDVEAILTDGSLEYDVAPKGIGFWAKAMVAQGMLKKAPDRWQDTFFPYVGDRKGD
jgi:NitT/TauT family transport system substrate-binding protein